MPITRNTVLSIEVKVFAARILSKAEPYDQALIMDFTWLPLLEIGLRQADLSSREALCKLRSDRR